MIQIKQLSKSFSTKKVLENVNLTIKDGTIMGLVGINGAGKSTLLRLISGVYKQEKGEIIIDNETVFDNEKIKEKIFFLPDEPYYERNTTPASLYELYSTFYKINKAEYWEYLNKFNLPYNSPIHNFSKGMKRQVFVSLAIAIKPKYLLLDEAFDGLDPLARLTFKKALIDFVEDKKSSVIISSIINGFRFDIFLLNSSNGSLQTTLTIRLSCSYLIKSILKSSFFTSFSNAT